MNQLTKDAIAKALTDLLQERPIEKITIKDITDRCGINRQTFYYHFSDIYDLMEWTLDKELRKALGTREISPTDWKEYVRKIFAVMRSQKRGLLNAYDEKNRLYYEVFLKKEIQPVVRQLVSECPEAEEVSEENVYRRSVYQNPVKFLPGMDRRRDAGRDTGSAGGLFYTGRRQYEQCITAV